MNKNLTINLLEAGGDCAFKIYKEGNAILYLDRSLDVAVQDRLTTFCSNILNKVEADKNYKPKTRFGKFTKKDGELYVYLKRKRSLNDSLGITKSVAKRIEDQTAIEFWEGMFK